jgi:hypothetical protein
VWVGLDGTETAQSGCECWVACIELDRYCTIDVSTPLDTSPIVHPNTHPVSLSPWPALVDAQSAQRAVPAPARKVRKSLECES